MNQEIKVTKCVDCPMCEKYNDYTDIEYSCSKDAFNNIWSFDESELLYKGIHPNCPLKGQTITYKIGENE